MSDRIAMLVVIAALLGLSGWLGNRWQTEVKDYAEYRGRAEQAAKDAQVALETQRKEWEGVVADVNHKRDAEIPGVQESAVANYVRRFGRSTHLCPGPVIGVQPQPALPTGEAGVTPTPGVDVPGEPEQLAPDQAAFVRTCADDAYSRNLTRETLLRLGFKPEGTP